MEYFWFLLITSITYCVSNNQNRVFKTDSDEFQSVLVTELDDVIARDNDNLLQFRRGDISASGLINQVDIPRNQIFDDILQVFRYKPTVFQLFSLSNHQYLLQCHFNGCSTYNVTDIMTSSVVQEDDYSEYDFLPHDTVSAQFVMFKTDEWMRYHSATTDSEGINILYSGYLHQYGDNVIRMEVTHYIKSKKHQNFHFVYSFRSGNKYTYFLRNVHTDYKNKVMISQVCDDEYFRSYIETELLCGNFSHVVSATTIVAGGNSFLAVAMGDNDTSALCIYDFQKIEEHFDNALSSCFKRAKGSWPQWIDEAGDSCTEVYTGREFKCGHTNINRRIVSNESLTTQYITKFNLDGHVANHNMVFKNYNDIVIGYIGFQIGNILKVIFEQSTMQITRHELLSVSSAPIRQIVLNNNGTFLFYISSNELGKMLVDPTKCPLRINEIKPMNGTLDGGTVLTLSGQFGHYSTYTSNRPVVNVIIGNSTCQITQPNTYDRVTCVTQEQTSVGNLTVYVNISSENLYATSLSCHAATEYDSTFSYLEPILDNSTTMETTRIKLTGCTPIRIHGNNLDVGSKREIFVGDKMCAIIGYNSTTATCRSPEQSSIGDYHIKYTLDHTTLVGPLVAYVPEPNITSIEPQYTILSGGIAMTIAGENLDALGTDLRLYLQGVPSDVCEFRSNMTSHTVICMTPPSDFVSEVQPFIRNDRCVNVSVDIPIWSVHDPIMEKEHQGVRVLPDQNYLQLSFKGSNLTYIRGTDVKIRVGTMECVNVEVLDDEISCSVLAESIPKLLKERVICEIGFKTYELGTIALLEIPKTNRTQDPSDDTNYSGIIIGSLFACVFVACIAAFIVRRRQKKKYAGRYSVRYNNNGQILSLEGLSEAPISETGQSRSNEYLSGRHLRVDNTCTNVKETVPLIPQIDRDLKDLMDHKHLLISKDCLVMGEIIGEGHFGCVFKGNLQKETEKADRIVACKTLHRNNPEQLDVNSFLKEALVMKDFHHKNVMELVGVCLGINALPIVVLPYMRMGDLLSYIRNISNVPTVKQLVLFGVDIANGMDYLSELKFVHRDLAARNCMIDDDMTVKVADFGLSRDVYEKEYYTSCDKKAKLPVKWMSPESLEFGHFSTKSDVWSFGVLMWELLTRGVNPYPTVDGWDILRYLKTGRRLDKPEFCPDEMYRILQSCWECDPDKRPTFGNLTVSIPELLRKLERASERRKLFSSRSVDTDTTDHVIVIDNVTIRDEGTVIEKEASPGDVEDIKEELKTSEKNVAIGKIETPEHTVEIREKYKSEDNARNEDVHQYVNKDAIR